MKRGVISLAIACVGFMMASCGTGKQAVSAAALEGEWSIVEIDGKVLATNEQLPTIGFDAKARRIYGNSGCNRMMGTYLTDSVTPGSLSFGPIAGTRMACPDMATEQRVLAALGKVKSFKKLSCGKGNGASCKVALCDDQGKPVAVIEKAQVNISALNGEWSITRINGEAVGKSEQEPFIGFDVAEGRIYGCAGCNNMNGALKQDGKNPLSISFDPVATTMMACMDMETEGKVLKALNEVKSFNMLDNGEAGLYNVAGELIVTLAKR